MQQKLKLKYPISNAGSLRIGLHVDDRKLPLNG